MGILTYTSLFASNFSLLVATIDRFRAIQWPFHTEKFQKRLCIISVVVIWSIMLFMAMLPLSRLDGSGFELKVATWSFPPTHGFLRLFFEAYLARLRCGNTIQKGLHLSPVYNDDNMRMEQWATKTYPRWCLGLTANVSHNNESSLWIIFLAQCFRCRCW